MRHRDGREPVLLARIVQMPLEESHQLAPLSLALPPLRRLRNFFLNVGEYFAYGFHVAFCSVSIKVLSKL